MHKAELRKLLCAMLLGDGTITRNGNSKVNPNHKNSYWFSFHHSMKQVDWAEQKISYIENFFKKKGVTRTMTFKKNQPQYSKKTNKTYYSCSFRLYWTTYMRIMRKWVYREDNTKRAEFLLGQLESDRHLAIWFMDDGSEEHNKNKHKDGTIYLTNPRLMLHICDFTQKDAEYIAQWFRDKYDVDPRIVYTAKKQGTKPRLRFLAKDSRKLFNRISVYCKQTKTGRNKFSLCFERY